MPCGDWPSWGPSRTKRRRRLHQRCARSWDVSGRGQWSECFQCAGHSAGKVLAFLWSARLAQTVVVASPLAGSARPVVDRSRDVCRVQISHACRHLDGRAVLSRISLTW
jgi:hypothetical protein